MTNEISKPVDGVTVQLEGDTWLVNVDSIAALHTLSTKPQQRNMNKWTQFQTRTMGQTWYGVSSRQQVETILASGTWAYGVKRMEDALASEVDTPQSVRRMTRWADQGDSMDIHRIYSGAMDQAWRKVGPRRRTATQNISIFCNVTINAGQDADELFWRGAAAMKMADILSTAGYNVQVFAAFVTKNAIQSGDGVHVCMPVLVKDASAPLDLNALAVSICLAGFFRHAMFKAVCAVPSTISYGLGQACNYADIMPAESNRADIMCEGIRNKDSAQAWIAAQVAAIETQREAA